MPLRVGQRVTFLRNVVRGAFVIYAGTDGVVTKAARTLVCVMLYEAARFGNASTSCVIWSGTQTKDLQADLGDVLEVTLPFAGGPAGSSARRDLDLDKPSSEIVSAPIRKRDLDFD